MGALFSVSRLAKRPARIQFNRLNTFGARMDKDKNSALTNRSGGEKIAAFVEAAKKVPAPGASGRGRLIFALDATMSRQPTWDLAQSLQAKMFEAAGSLGGLDVQLVYFRGLNECRASNFVSGGQGLAQLMSRIDVRGGSTQIKRVLAHARDEARRAKVGALVFIGDAMEENPDTLASLAGELALLGVKAFMFQEGQDPAREAHVQRNRPTDRRGLQRLRRRRFRAARGAPARGGGLCRGRPRGARSGGGGRRGGAALAVADARKAEVGVSFAFGGS